ncbi:phage tail protein [Bacillus infantis]|uniref:phage tail protein n=1 Tax=Bacillus infantis TaxID=324767 RepID=UPI001653847B|nr:phage tail protein [Bacillus infantis]
MIGFFGKLVFEVSDKKIKTFSNFKRDTAGRWNKHDTIGKLPASEFIGPDLDTISFDIKLSAAFGVKPYEEMEKWYLCARNGNAEMLVIGKKRQASGRWVVKQVSQAWDVVLNNGAVYSLNMTVSLEEYTERIK